jgi:hypothetical protein
MLPPASYRELEELSFFLPMNLAQRAKECKGRRQAPAGQDFRSRRVTLFRD